MNSRTIPYLLGAMAILFVACKKDEVDIADLNTNPFDADYAGQPVFSFISASTATEVINGVPQRVLAVNVRVHTELFGRPTTYQVEVGDPIDAVVPSNAIPDGQLSLRIPGVTDGQEYCTALRLGNDGAYGAGNSVCATAE